MPRLDQGLARDAFKVAEAAGDSREFASRARGLPAMAQGAGLAATIAFIASKAEPGNAYHQLGTALADRISAALGIDRLKLQQLPTVLGGLSVDQYRRATIEVRMFADWLARAVKALEPSS